MRLLLVLLLALLVTGCSALREAPGVQSRQDLLVSAGWLLEHQDRPDVVVLHVARARAHYDEGHVPGARFLPLSEVAVTRDDQVNVLPEAAALEAALRAVGVSPGSHVVLYGDLSGLAATRAFFALDVHGVGQGAGRLSVLDGGLQAWRSTGGAVSQASTPAPARGTVALALRSDLVVTAEAVEARRASAQTALVDARPAAQFAGEEPGENIRRPGHIPGAASLFWQEDNRADGTLQSAPELLGRYARVGVVPGRDMIAYCRTGVQASHTYFVLRTLGFAPRLYDGSFYDWSNNTAYPVATGR